MYKSINEVNQDKPKEEESEDKLKPKPKKFETTKNVS